MSRKMPLVKVVEVRMGEGMSINGDFSMRWWDLLLECGHRVERRVRFPKQVGEYRRGFLAQYHPRPRSEALSPPKRCRCEFCGPGKAAR